MVCSSKEQLYWKRLGQLELIEELLDYLRKHDRNEVLFKLEKLYVEVNEELRVLRRELDLVIAEISRG